MKNSTPFKGADDDVNKSEHVTVYGTFSDQNVLFFQRALI